MLPININLVDIPKLYEQQECSNPILYAKFSIPEVGWEWYVMEYSPLQKLCYGLIVCDEVELGYFSLDELQSIQYKYGVVAQYDYKFKPIGLKALQN